MMNQAPSIRLLRLLSPQDEDFFAGHKKRSADSRRERESHFRQDSWNDRFVRQECIQLQACLQLRVPQNFWHLIVSQISCSIVIELQSVRDKVIDMEILNYKKAKIDRVVQWKWPACPIGTSEESPITRFVKAFGACWRRNSFLHWMRKFCRNLILPNNLVTQIFTPVGQSLDRQISGASNVTFPTCSARHYTRTIFITPWSTLFQQTRSTNTLVRPCFRTTAISIISDLLRRWFRSTRMSSRVINPTTRTIIRL
jgi:hypothetical protein